MALILVESNACFLHIPKTGGVWVEQALNNAGVATEWADAWNFTHQRHSPRGGLKRKYSHYFSFVRHPCSWYESWWKYVNSPISLESNSRPLLEPNPVDERHWHPQQSIRRFRGLPFADAVSQILEHNPGYVTWLYRIYVGRAQKRWALVDYIGRQERLVADLVAILNRIGAQYEERKLTSTPPANMSECLLGEPDWPNGLKERVLAVESECIDRFYSDGIKSSEIGFR